MHACTNEWWNSRPIFIAPIHFIDTLWLMISPRSLMWYDRWISISVFNSIYNSHINWSQLTFGTAFDSRFVSKKAAVVRSAKHVMRTAKKRSESNAYFVIITRCWYQNSPHYKVSWWAASNSKCCCYSNDMCEWVCLCFDSGQWCHWFNSLIISAHVLRYVYTFSWTWISVEF